MTPLSFLCPLLLLSLSPSVDSGRILIYSPAISISHLISNGRIADTLVDAGHEVVMFILEYSQMVGKFNGTTKAKIIRMNGLYEHFDALLAECETSFGESEVTPVSLRLAFEDSVAATCRDILSRRSELEQLRVFNFDLAFSEQLDTCGAGIIRYLGIQNHLWISTTALMEANSYRLGIPQPSSYVPTIEENDNGDVMDFWQRAYNLWMYGVGIVVHQYGVYRTTAVFREALGGAFPDTGEIVANSSLCFVNIDEQFDFARPIIAKNIFIGGLGIRKKEKKLDEKFSAIMSKGEKGVILFSFGTIAPFNALPQTAQNGIISVFRRLDKFHFVLKITADDNTTASLVADLKNVDIATWLPQSHLIRHPRVRAFVMHGGLNSLMEAAHAGVPLIITPFFADQFRNGRLVEKRGMGKVILRKDLNEKSFSAALNDILSDKRYAEAAQRTSKLLRTRPFSPEERLVKWTEFAMENGVLSHLHVEGARLNSLVYFNLDVFAALFAVAFLTCFASFKLITFPCRSREIRKVKLH